MMLRAKFVIASLLCSFLVIDRNETHGTEILWDDWGVPHVYADSEQEMFFGLGWSQMKSHGNLILELFGKSRGRAAEYWGKQHLTNDILIHRLQFPTLATTWTQQQDAKHAELVRAFVAGMNSFAASNPKALASANRVVLPITVDDINLHSLFIFYSRFVGGRDLGRTRQWQEMGSNSYAISPKRSASGNAMLVQNPHLPWGGEFLFYEAHGIAPNVNIYGANLVGLPGFGIAFNENLGWSHTNNTIDNADSYELTLKDDGYLLDGEVKPFKVFRRTLKVKDEQGHLSDYTIETKVAEHGSVIREGEKKAVAIRFPTLDRVNSGKQWYEMGKARNYEQFENALEMSQIPFWNILYADRDGNIMYLFNGHIPKRGKGDWRYWDRLVPGDQADNIWRGIHAQAELPIVKNPSTGWLQNANDPPWTCTFPAVLSPDQFPAYFAPRAIPHYFRPQRSIRMLFEDSSVTFDELVEYKLSTRMEMADRLLDDLYHAVDAHGDDVAKQAKLVLQAWDRHANADSQGAVLFAAWAQKLSPRDPRVFQKPYSAKSLLQTPDGFSQPAEAAKKLSEAATEVQARWGSIDVPWGEVVRLRIGQYDLPANGADGSLGVFRVASPVPDKDGKQKIRSGDSWVSVIEFGKKVRAKVLLSYGNATQPDSPHYGDQLKLFSENKLRDARYYRDDVERHVKTREVLQDGRFVAVQK